VVQADHGRLQSVIAVSPAYKHVPSEEARRRPEARQMSIVDGSSGARSASEAPPRSASMASAGAVLRFDFSQRA
jgi:hypothetical protein